MAFYQEEAFLAQLVEHPPCKRKVRGSIPRGGNSFLFFTMEYKTNTYEALTRHMYVSWALVLDVCFTEQEVIAALKHVHAKHPHLRCRIHEGTHPGDMSLLEKEVGGPVVSVLPACVQNVDEFLENCVEWFSNDRNVDDTVHYWLLLDSEQNQCVLVACFCHSCVDALSSLRVATDFLLYLDSPSLSIPNSRPFVSVQNEIVLKNPDGNNTPYKNQTEVVWIAPIRLHDDGDVSGLFRTKQIVLPPETIDAIVKMCRDHGCTYQSYLWLCILITQMRLFQRSFPLSVRFNTPVTTIGRATFAHPISSDDLVVGAYSCFVQTHLEGEQSFWDVCRRLTAALKQEIESGDQMNDFFSVCQTLDFGKLPSASFNGCTLGVTDLKHQYSHFSLKNIYFLPATSRSPGMGGMNVHAFTVAGLGCFVNCTYWYPGFTSHEMAEYTQDLQQIFKRVCEGDCTLQQVLDHS